MQLTHNNRKQISGCLGMRNGREGKTAKGCKKTYGGGGPIHYLNCGDGFMG